MKTPLLLMMIFLVSCTTAMPRKYSRDITAERDVIIFTAMPKFQECVKLDKGEVRVQMKFKLFSAQAPLFVRPQKVAFDPKTNHDEIVISLMEADAEKAVEVTCLKDVLKKLEFHSVNPTYEYMETHEYVMEFKAAQG